MGLSCISLLRYGRDRLWWWYIYTFIHRKTNGVSDVCRSLLLIVIVFVFVFEIVVATLVEDMYGGYHKAELGILYNPCTISCWVVARLRIFWFLGFWVFVLHQPTA